MMGQEFRGWRGARAPLPWGGGVVVVLVMLGGVAWGQFGELPPARGQTAADDKAAEEAKNAYEANLVKHRGNADVLVLPGLVADRKSKQVRIWGKATGVGHGDPVEFFVIPPDSGKEYEAMVVGFVKPSDVHRALEFIGMKGGRAVNFAANQFWPKGERVLMTVEWEQAGKAGLQRVRAEELVIDARTGKALAKTGLVFTGSFWIKPEEEGGKERYAADVVDPRAIAANFNCWAAVMDVPRQAIQGEVYGSQKLNPAYQFAAGQGVQIVLEPEYKDGRVRVVDLSLRAEIGARGVEFVLKDAAEKKVNEGPTLVHVLAACNTLIEGGRDPFVAVSVDERMTVEQVRELYQLLMSVEGEEGIRIEGPAEGELFCRAFFPREDWRERKNRLGRPWELHLEGGKDGTLILPADEIDDNRGMGDLTFKVKSGEEVAKVLTEKSDRFSMSVCVFVPGKMRYGEMMGFLRAGMKTHKTVYVF